MDLTDAECLADYCDGRPAAFADLARRHVDLVYAAALRRTRDPAVADDVTQAVFLVLARRARALRSHATLAGWLLVTTRNAARTAARSAARRTRHERAAARTERIVNPAPLVDADTLRILDHAIAALGRRDRDAIVLRYHQSQSLADVGRTLGISEEAARKRVDRGVSRLRVLLVRRGLTMNLAAVSAAAVALAAPPAPAATLAAITLPAASAAGPAAALSKGMLHMMTTKHIAVAVAVAVAVALPAGMAVRTRLASSALSPGSPAAAASTPRDTPPPAVSAAPAFPLPGPTVTPLAPDAVGEVYIGGVVRKPGAYSFNRDRPTLKQVLLDAGVDTAADLTVERVRQLGGGNEAYENFRLTDLLADPTAGERVQPDDHLNVRAVPAIPSLKFAAVSITLPVRSVQDNLSFFGRLGFTRRFTEPADTPGGPNKGVADNGVLRVHLVQAEPAPEGGVGASFWIPGGDTALTAYRDAVSKYMPVGPIEQTGSSSHFVVTSPDGYAIGIYTVR